MSNKKILIVGGVAGGASAATRARRLDETAEIILFEKDPHVSFANCGLPYYIGGEISDRKKLLVATPEFLSKRFKLDVRTRHEVTSINRTNKTVEVLNHVSGVTSSESYDKLILAPGASPLVPPIAGVHSKNVMTLRNLEDTDRIKSYIDTAMPKRAVVIGSGYIGLEMLEQLVGLKIEVCLVELMPQVLPLFDPEMAYPLQQMMIEHGVSIYVNDAVEAFETNAEQATAAKLKSGSRIEADLFILGVGVRPNTKLAIEAGLTIGNTGGILVNDFMQTSDPDIYAVGDATEYVYGPTQQRMRVALAGPANRAGRLAGEHAVTGSSSPMGSVYGTSIVRVFGQTAAMTGLTRKQANKLGINARSTIVIANQHAGYYPGAQAMTLKLVYSPETGKVLGAQAIGADGIDKRMDVIATAMRFNATVRDLTELDLAYAPPFGSAKDPVHMAAFAASNEMDGFVKFLDPDADLSQFQVIDVRNPPEIEKSPLADAPHALKIPLDELRDRLNEADASKPTVVSCASGLRSYVASRILMQNGFKEVYDLSGAATLRARAVAAKNQASKSK